MTAVAPLHVVVMGVSGTGKSTVAEALADRLGHEFIEGDSFHPPANIAKMTAGTPLDDADRLPWLQSLGALVRERHGAGVSTVLSCSALRRCYRDVLRQGASTDLVFLHLQADEVELAARMRSRDHFMPSTLLRSQLDTLEPLGPSETGAVIEVNRPLDAVLADAIRLLRR